MSAQLVTTILRQSVREETGDVRPLTLADVLMVAPFNAQVNLLMKILLAGIRVGTVDKFQGQEAMISIVSISKSDDALAPRGSQLLFNANRLNVAVSRAKCLAIVVGGTNLLHLYNPNIEDLERLDAFVRADVASANNEILGVPEVA